MICRVLVDAEGQRSRRGQQLGVDLQILQEKERKGHCTLRAAISRRPSSVTPGHLRTTMRRSAGSGDSSSADKPRSVT